jgi:hypothetical protein
MGFPNLGEMARAFKAWPVREVASGGGWKARASRVLGTADKPFLAFMPDGLPDSLYEANAQGLPRVLAVLPDSSRAFRRMVAKELRVARKKMGSPVGPDEDDLSLLLWYFESLEIRAQTFWLCVEQRGGRPVRFSEFPVPLDLVLLMNASSQVAKRTEPFNEDEFARHCPVWDELRASIEAVADKPFEQISLRSLSLLTLWPALRNELVTLPVAFSERGRQVMEGIFALSSVTKHPFFLNEACRLQSAVAEGLLEIEDRLLWGLWEHDDPKRRVENAKAKIQNDVAATGKLKPAAALRARERAHAEVGAAPKPTRDARESSTGERMRAGETAEAKAPPVVPPAVVAEPPSGRPAGRSEAKRKRAAQQVAEQDGRPEVRPIVQVRCELEGEDPAAAIVIAREEVLGWLAEKGVRNLPEHARDGAPFEIDATEGVPVVVEAFDNVWGVRFDTPDKDVLGRLWRSEIIVGTLEGRACVAVGVTAISPNAGVPMKSEVPRLVKRLLERPGLRDGGARLLSTARRVETDAEVDDLVALLEHHERSTPVHVVSEAQVDEGLLDAQLLARGLEGIGHVVSLSEPATRLLAARVGGGLDVHGRAMRTYQPGFASRSAVVTGHPVTTEAWVAQRFGGVHDFLADLKQKTLEGSTRGSDLERHLPTFARVRHWANERRLEEARKENLGAKDLVALYAESTKSLTAELKENEAKMEALQLRQLEVEEELDEALNESRQLRGRISFLEKALKARSGPEPMEYPRSYDEVSDWVARHLSDSVVLLSRAERSLKKAVFDNLRFMCDCVSLLAGPYREMRRGTMERAAFDAACAALGVMLTKSGDSSTQVYAREYEVAYEKTRRTLDLHLKRGASRDPTKCLRIYFFYDEATERVVIGHLPSHLTTVTS